MRVKVDDARAPTTGTPTALKPLPKVERLSDPYVTAGDRLYVVGAQDGSFPDMGWHVPGEMGGVWAHPVKLLDGFWLRIDGIWLTEALRFVSGPFWGMHEYTLADGLTIVRRQFVPDGLPALIVRYTFRSSVARTLELQFLARTDLQRVWNPEAAEPDGQDMAVYQPDLEAWLCQDEANQASVLVGACGTPVLSGASGRELWGPQPCLGRGISVTLEYHCRAGPAMETYLDFIIAGSDQSTDITYASFRQTRDSPHELWEAKARRYDTMLGLSALTIPDPVIGEAWQWVKCNYDWLIREVPGTGRGLGAGIQDYPWWFGCDNAFAVLGCLALGQRQTALETLDLIRELSVAANGASGRVIHECTTAGQTTNRGLTQETPHFISTVWQAFRWTGDIAFLRRMYDFCKAGLLDWTLGDQRRGDDLLPSGYGIVEILHFSFQCLDTAVHTVVALHALAGMARVMGDEATEQRCESLAVEARTRLHSLFWMEEEEMYGDIVATPAEMAPVIEGWLEEVRKRDSASRLATGLEHYLRQARADPEQDRKRPWNFKNWTVVSPLEAGLVDPERASRVFARLESAEFSNKWGMYVNSLAGDDVMSINTGSLAVAELRYGRVDEGIRFIREIALGLKAWMPGAIAEISPNRGCFVQAWSGYGIAWPLVTQIFGLQPDAYQRRLTINPLLPPEWGEVALSNVRIGDATFEFRGNADCLRVRCSDPSWTVLASNSAIEVQDSPM